MVKEYSSPPLVLHSIYRSKSLAKTYLCWGFFYIISLSIKYFAHIFNKVLAAQNLFFNENKQSGV